MEFSSPVYEAVRDRLHARFGDPVQEWWQRLPSVVAVLSDRWAVTITTPVGRGNASLVLRCRRADGSPAMIKLTPDSALAAAEATSLKAWASSGRVPAVWAEDVRFGALLLEAITDETPVSESNAPVAVSEVSGLIAALHHAAEPAVGNGVVSLSERVEFIFSHSLARYRDRPDVLEVVSPARLQRAYHLAHRLAREGGLVLLHGDLHPGNVLNGGEDRGLIAIDPRACIGDPAFDAVDWVFWNADAELWHVQARELASALDVDPARLWSWCSAFATILAAGKIARGGTPEDAAPLLAVAY
jgi:streptomycin 6-kinase